MTEKKLFIFFGVLISVMAACTLQGKTAGTSESAVTETRVPTAPILEISPTSPVTEAELPPVVGPDPSDRVAVFYYPWYGNPDTDGQWVHWNQNVIGMPEIIGSDYYPVLGAYSANDRSIVAQHFAWLREYGVGVVIVSWWGRGGYEDQAIPLLLEMGERYGIKVAFHIEPYFGRSAENLVADVRYLYSMYGDSSAFYRSEQPSRWSTDDKAKGLFFIWATEIDYNDGNYVQPEYWQSAVDEIHNFPDGGLVIANDVDGSWIDGGHFDGLYNYATLSTGEPDMFDWAASIPPDAWFIPSVLPGFSAVRIGYSSDSFVPRENGVTYIAQWQAALNTGIEPTMVTITSFNEWHEGSQIEPARPVSEIAQGEDYSDYETLSPAGYLELTETWAAEYLTMEWPENYPVRIQLSTTSDWTTLNLVEGGKWTRADFIQTSEDAGFANFVDTLLSLDQPLDQAMAGNTVSMTVDLLFVLEADADQLRFEVQRGGIGSTTIAFYQVVDGEEILLDTVTWAGSDNTDVNAHQFILPVELILD